MFQHRSQEVKADARLQQAAKKEGKSPKSPAKSSTPQKSRNQTDKLLTSPTSPNQNLASSTPVRLELDRSGEQTTSPRTVPAIEITRESGTEILNSPIVDSDKDFPKSDSSESVTSSKVSSKQRGGDRTDKYSANFDQRDGYRDSHHDNHSKSVKQKRDISNDTARTRSHSSSPRGMSPRHDSRSPRRDGDPGDHRHSKGASPHASSHSPRAKGSPHENSSPHDRERSGDRSRQNIQRSSSPHQNQRASANASPNAVSKLNAKSGSGFHGNKDSNANELTPNNVISSSDLRNISKLDLIDDDDGGDVDSISGEINPPMLDDNRIRLFVALFDYDPETMSPNVDATDEELPFREGQVIKVYGDKDADGFYRGECGGQLGFILCNMVSEIQVDDPDLEESLLNDCHVSSSVGNPAVASQLSASEKYQKVISNGIHASPNSLAPIAGEVTVRRMVAMYDYDPQELSPNVDAEVELSFKVGDLLMTFGEMDDDGFYMGELNGRRGLVPSNFLQETGISDDEAIDSVSVVTTARSGESINTTDSRKSDKIEKRQSPKQDGSPDRGTSPSPRPEQIEPVSNQIGMLTPRSLTPEEIKHKKKSGGILSKGKSIFKKFTK